MIEFVNRPKWNPGRLIAAAAADPVRVRLRSSAFTRSLLAFRATVAVTQIYFVTPALE
jgi:hypothetical protein